LPRNKHGLSTVGILSRVFAREKAQQRSRRKSNPLLGTFEGEEEKNLAADAGQNGKGNVVGGPSRSSKNRLGTGPKNAPSKKEEALETRPRGRRPG